jgi:hypothetical protein
VTRKIKIMSSKAMRIIPTSIMPLTYVGYRISADYERVEVARSATSE